MQVMDYGYPQFTEAKILSEFIKTDAYKMEVRSLAHSKVPASHMRAVHAAVDLSQQKYLKIIFLLLCRFKRAPPWQSPTQCHGEAKASGWSSFSTSTPHAVHPNCLHSLLRTVASEVVRLALSSVALIS